jgi:hypothetical protein
VSRLSEIDPALHIKVMSKLLILVPLVALLAVSVWFMIYAWGAIDGPPVPTEGKVAMGLGVFFSIVVGCGLMALVFYSSRHGYDEGGHYDSADQPPRA